MPSLQVRELPEQIYLKLQAQARKEHRSFSQQAIVTLAKGLDIVEDPKIRRIELLKRMLKRPIIADASNLTDPAELVRKDRER